VARVLISRFQGQKTVVVLPKPGHMSYSPDDRAARKQAIERFLSFDFAPR
jgi:hypothetical protein